MNLAETETYEAGIYQLEITDPVIGGPDGIDNLQAKQLANRTNWLKAKIDSVLGMSFIHTAVAENPGDTDEFGYWDSFTQTLRKVTLANLKATLKTYFDTAYQAILVNGITIKTLNGLSLLGSGDLKVSSPSGIRQTIQTGLNDANGYCAITTTSANLILTLLASPNEPVSVHAWGGTISKDRFVEIVANMTLSLPASAAAVYCYIDIDANNIPTLGYTLLAPIYQNGGAISMVNGQFTCDISAGKCYVGVAGTSYVQVWRVFFQESVTSASAITSVVNYALNGMYDSGYTQNLPAIGTAVSKNHNIGIIPMLVMVTIKCTTSDNGYLVNDELVLVNTGSTANGAMSICKNKKTCGFTNGSAGQMFAFHKTTGVAFNMPQTSWAYKLTAQRGW